MNKTARIILSILIWPVGIALYFKTKDINEKDANMYLIIGIASAFIIGGSFFSLLASTLS